METAQPQIETITLDAPIRRGELEIATVQLRKPKAGEMRGLQLQSLMQGDVNAVLALIPRISIPSLIAAEVEALEADDFAAMTGAVSGFFMSKADRQILMRVMGAVEETSTN
jgi:hypothetical protein